MVVAMAVVRKLPRKLPLQLDKGDREGRHPFPIPIMSKKGSVVMKPSDTTKIINP
jgi:hypothetical protein